MGDFSGVSSSSRCNSSSARSIVTGLSGLTSPVDIPMTLIQTTMSNPSPTFKTPIYQGRTVLTILYPHTLVSSTRSSIQTDMRRSAIQSDSCRLRCVLLYRLLISLPSIPDVMRLLTCPKPRPETQTNRDTRSYRCTVLLCQRVQCHTQEWQR